MSTTLYIFGTGPHARKIAQCAGGAGWSVAAFVDEAADARSPVEGVPALVASALAAPRAGEAVFVAIGRPEVRRRLMDELAARGWRLPALVHATAWVAPDAELADGVVVCAGAVVETQARIGRGVIVDSGSVVDHDARVGEFFHVRPGTVVASYSEVEAVPAARSA